MVISSLTCICLLKRYQILKFYNNHICIDKCKFKLSVIDEPGYDPIDNNCHKWLDNIVDLLKEKHKSYWLMNKVYTEDTRLSRIEIDDRLKKLDARVHMCLYFVNPDLPPKKFDIYAMKKLQRYVHILPIIGKADTKKAKDILALKLDLVSMAHMNSLRYFDIYSSLCKKLQNYGEKVLNYFIEDSLGPCPPFSIITLDEEIITEDSKGNKLVKYGRQFNWGFCNSLEDGSSDLIRLFKVLIMTCKHAIKTTDHLSVDVKRELSADKLKQVSP